MLVVRVDDIAHLDVDRARRVAFKPVVGLAPLKANAGNMPPSLVVHIRRPTSLYHVTDRHRFILHRPSYWANQFEHKLSDYVIGLRLLGTSRRSEEHTSELQSLRHLVCR